MQYFTSRQPSESGNTSLKTALHYIYIITGILLFVVATYAATHTSIAPDINKFSYRYIIFLGFLYALSLFSTCAGMFLAKHRLINIAILLISTFTLLGFVELSLIVRPQWLIPDRSLLIYMDARSALYLRALSFYDAEHNKMVNDRAIFDGLYFRYKPGINFDVNINTFEGEKQNTIYIDEIGFRNKYGTYSQNSSIPYVFLGDSGTFGIGSSIPFPQAFGELTGDTILNLGIGGHGPQMYHRSLEQFGVQKTPSIIFVTLFLNDIQNGYSFELLEKDGKDSDKFYLLYAAGLRFPWPNNVAAKLVLQHCNICIYVDATIKSSLSPKSMFTTDSTSQGYTIVLDNNMTPIVLTETLKPPQKMCPHNPCIEPSIKALRKIAKLGQSINSRVILTYLPMPSEIYYPYIQQGRLHFYSTHNPQANDFGWAKELSKIAMDLEIEFADPRDFLIKEAAESPFLFIGINDPHLSDHGHKVFAQFLHHHVTSKQTR